VNLGRRGAGRFDDTVVNEDGPIGVDVPYYDIQIITTPFFI